MNNYLDIALLATDLSRDHADAGTRLAGEPRLGIAVAAHPPAHVKAPFAHAPVERAECITGRWLPSWPDQAADAAA